MNTSGAVWTRYWPVIVALALVALLYLLSPVLAPFVTAAILAYILEPLVARLVRRGMHRAYATPLVLAAMALLGLALLLIIVPLFVRQLAALYGYLPYALSWLRDVAVPWLSLQIGVEIPLDVEHLRLWLLEHGDAAGDILQQLVPSLTSGGLALAGMLANIVLLPVVLFYFLRDWPSLLQEVEAMVPRRWHRQVASLAAEVDGVLGEFLRGQLSVMLIMATLYSVALWLVGLQSALPIGVIAGLLVFVPYLGVIIGLLLAALAALLQFQSLGGLLAVVTIFMLGQVLEGFWVTPKLVGERVGLHPVAVIFALMAFGQLFGFVGVLLALPLAAVVLVGLRHLRSHYLRSSLYRPVGSD